MHPSAHPPVIKFSLTVLFCGAVVVVAVFVVVAVVVVVDDNVVVSAVDADAASVGCRELSNA